MTDGFSQKNKLRILSIMCGCEGGGYHPLFELSRILNKDFHSVEIICDDTTGSVVKESGIPAYELPSQYSAGHYYLPLISQLLKNKQPITGDTPNPLQQWADRAAAILLDEARFAAPDIILSSLFGQPLADALASRLDVPWGFVNPAFSYLDHSIRDWRLDFSSIGAQMYRSWLLPFTENADFTVHATDPLFDCASTIVENKEIYTGPLFYERILSSRPVSSEKTGSHVIATISTSPQPEDQQLLELIIEAGKRIQHPMIVTTRNSKDSEKNSLSHIEVTGYQPHSTLLKSCRYVICHGGHGTVMKAMAAGVPMIIVPWGRDQAGNARRAEKLGVAVVIAKSECNSQRLVDAAFQLESFPHYKQQAKEHAARIRESHIFGNAYRTLVSYMISLATG